MEYIIAWNGVNGKVLSGGYLFDLEVKPDLYFAFESLYYETPTGLSFYNASDDKGLLCRNELSIEQIEACQVYCKSFIHTANYTVHTYDTENIYKGSMPKSKARELGFMYTLENSPDSLNSKWTGTEWQKIAVAFDEDGKPEFSPPVLKNSHVLFMTQAEYDNLPERKRTTEYLNFVTQTWHDCRTLDKVKFDAKIDIRGYFEHSYIVSGKGRITAQEMQTWALQFQEARAFLEDVTVPTPFLDGFLEHVQGMDKIELCQKIVDEYAEAAVREQGRRHGQLYSYLYRVDAAQNADAVDTIVMEVFGKIGKHRVFNIYSKYPPVMHSKGSDVILAGDMVYHGIGSI